MRYDDSLINRVYHDPNRRPTKAILDRPYLDEFGAIESAVFEASLKLQPKVEQEALRTLGDADAGQRLLMKACAQVTRRCAETRITNLPGYLYRVWRRLLLDELEKQNGHRRIEESLAHPPTTFRRGARPPDSVATNHRPDGRLDATRF